MALIFSRPWINLLVTIASGHGLQEIHLTEYSVCELEGGHGTLEMRGGWQLLHEKIEVAPIPGTSENDGSHRRILCAIFTDIHNRDVARGAALSWGCKCDGFLAFSSETIPGLGFVDLIYPEKTGPVLFDHRESFWQRIRSVWAYIGEHYVNDFDYFHWAGGHDSFVIVENL